VGQLITAESVDDLGIGVGRDVFAVIKATDVMIGIAPV
jgi:molybdopterin-binding protein